MATFLFGLLLVVPPLLACACFVWAVLHGHNHLARWYRTDMRRRAYWLAFWLTMSRHILFVVLYAYAWKKTDLGLAILLYPLIILNAALQSCWIVCLGCRLVCIPKTIRDTTLPPVA